MGPDLEQALQWVAAGAVGQDPRAPLHPERDRVALVFQAAHRTYPEVFEALLAMTLFRSPVDHRLPRDQAYDYALLREGQNQVAAGMLDYLNHAKALEGGPHDRQPERSAGSPGGDAEPQPDGWDGGSDRDPFHALGGGAHG